MIAQQPDALVVLNDTSESQLSKRIGTLIATVFKYGTQNLSGVEDEIQAISREVAKLESALEKERNARQEAQASNERLKTYIVKTGIERRRAVWAEREACAKLCEDLRDVGEEDRAKAELSKDPENTFAIRHYQVVSMFNHGMSKCAAAIRAMDTTAAQAQKGQP